MVKVAEQHVGLTLYVYNTEVIYKPCFDAYLITFRQMPVKSALLCSPAIE